MLKHVKDAREAREILLSLLGTSGTLAGISVALVGLIDLRAAGRVQSLADDLFIFSAFGFVLVCYLIFFAMRRLQSDRLSVWTALIDIVFLASLTLLVVAGFVVVYAFV